MKKSLKKQKWVSKWLSQGITKAEAMRKVKEKFGSGIASRDVGMIAKELESTATTPTQRIPKKVTALPLAVGVRKGPKKAPARGTLRYAVPSSPRDGRHVMAEAMHAIEEGSQLLKDLGVRETSPSRPGPRPYDENEAGLPEVVKVPRTTVGSAKESTMRRFVLHLDSNVIVEGCLFSDGHVELHGGGTVIKWLDP